MNIKALSVAAIMLSLVALSFVAAFIMTSQEQALILRQVEQGGIVGTCQDWYVDYDAHTQQFFPNVRQYINVYKPECSDWVRPPYDLNTETPPFDRHDSYCSSEQTPRCVTVP